jgi:hypothetical protein
MDYKCIKCSQLSTSNICKLNYIKFINEDCIGFDYISTKREELACKISELMTQYNNLEGLEEYIRDNQPK